MGINIKHPFLCDAYFSFNCIKNEPGLYILSLFLRVIACIPKYFTVDLTGVLSIGHKGIFCKVYIRCFREKNPFN